MEVTKFIMTETGTYNAPYLRPFKSQMDGHVIQQFQEATQGGTHVTPNNLAGIASSIIKPTAQPYGMVNIDNGWDTRRCRFLLEIIFHAGYGFANKQIIMGYSDHVGFSTNHHIDPNMRLYFNNSITLKTTMRDGVAFTGMADASQILIPQVTMQTPNAYGTNAISMRPCDVVSNMSTKELSGDVHDFRTMFFEGPKKSRRSNNIAPDFISTVIRGLNSAIRLNPDARDKTQAELYTNARDNIRDGLMSNDPFMRIITQKTGYSERGYVTYAELCAHFPTADQRCMFTPLVSVLRNGMHASVSGAGEYWSVTTSEAVLATTLLHAIPSIMLECMVTKCVIIATNETHDGSVYIELRNPASFTDGVDMQSYLMRLEDRMRFEVFNDISSNNLINFRVQMMVDVAGESRITISYASQPEVEFIMPSFSDGLMSPLVTSNRMDLSVIASDMDCLYNNGSPSNMMDHLAAYAPQPLNHQFNYQQPTGNGLAPFPVQLPPMPSNNV